MIFVTFIKMFFVTIFKCIELHHSSRGLLPALLIEDEAAGKREVVTESDVLLERLEGLFGPLGVKMNGAEARRDQLYKNRSSRKIDSQRLFSRE